MASYKSPWKQWLRSEGAAELILSPVYDFGFTEAELKAANLERLRVL